MGKPGNDRLYGTLDLLVLRVLSEGTPLHGYDIADRIRRTSGDVLKMEEGSLYPALHRMEEASWLRSRWEMSENNRKARYYLMTPKGRRHLIQLEVDWTTHVAAVGRVLKLA